MRKHALVLQSDFGISDGAVSAMYGVANLVDQELRIFDITHDIPPFNIWEASYRLLQTAAYWPEGTVFVSVVDPGVGSDRKSLVVKTATNHIVISPDNGTITHLKQFVGIIEAREIDETNNRLPYSNESYTFHGRDVYAYTGARLAANVIPFEEVGPLVPLEELAELPLAAAYLEYNQISGIIEILDIRYGNLWTNISRGLLLDLGISYGDSIDVTIEYDKQQIYRRIMKYERSFAHTKVGEPLAYINSLDNLGIAINQGSFAKLHHIGTGMNWRIQIIKI